MVAWPAPALEAALAKWVEDQAAGGVLEPRARAPVPFATFAVKVAAMVAAAAAVDLVPPARPFLPPGWLALKETAPRPKRVGAFPEPLGRSQPHRHPTPAGSYGSRQMPLHLPRARLPWTRCPAILRTWTLVVAVVAAEAGVAARKAEAVVAMLAAVGSMRALAAAEMVRAEV